MDKNKIILSKSFTKDVLNTISQIKDKKGEERIYLPNMFSGFFVSTKFSYEKNKEAWVGNVFTNLDVDGVNYVVICESFFGKKEEEN